MAKPQTSISHLDILRAVSKGELVPIYLLMGEEPYYIDRISEAITKAALSEEEKDFNLITIYCTKESQPADIINAAKRYPMMSKYQVVLVKEAQNLPRFEDLQFYLQKPLQSTILVICYKHGTVDRRKRVAQLASTQGILYESKRLKEGMLPSFIDDYLRQHNTLAKQTSASPVSIDDRARMMLVANIGSDLSRLTGEIDKLCITLPKGQTRITPELIERNIGISKDFNVWELRDAIVNHDILKANQILKYFNDNPKENAPYKYLPILFNLFASLMLAYYAPQKTEQGLMEQLDLRSPWQLRDIQTAMHHYTAMKTMLIITALRETDVKLKGVKKGNATDAEIMQQLLYFILH